MAHLIDMSNSRANMAYVGDTPWHGLGSLLMKGASIEVWQKEAGMNWKAEKAVVQYQPNHEAAAYFKSEEDSVVYRDDTYARLGLVSSNYKIVQPGEVLSFFKDLTEKYGYELDTAGCLKGGRIAWALARTGDVVRVRGNDIVNGYMLLSTSFDGSMATTARFTSVRVVCNNTLQMSMADAPVVKVSHRSVFDEVEAKRQLGVGAFHKFEEQANAMAERIVSVEEQIKFFTSVYHDMTLAELNDKNKPSVDKTMARLARILTTAPGQNIPSAKGTLWGLVNAVTHDVDFSKPSRSQDNRLTSSWFGDGAVTKAKAWDAALALVA